MVKKRVIVIAAALALAAVAGLLLHFAGKEYVYRFSEAQLQQKLGERLPLTRRFLVFFEVTLSQPRLHLQDGADRVAMGIDVALGLGNNGPLGGSIDVSGGVRYDGGLGAFFLTDPVIERVAVQGIPEKYAGKAREALTMALAAYYAERPIYTLNATDARQAAGRLVLRKVGIENRELVVTLGL